MVFLLSVYVQGYAWFREPPWWTEESDGYSGVVGMVG